MRDDQYVLNHCTPYLARANTGPIHDFGFGHYPPGDVRARTREAWRFPVVDTCSEPPHGEPAADFNDVTFVFPDFAKAVQKVSVLGTFSRLYRPIPLRRIRFLDEETGYLAATVAIPRAGVFFYRFLVDGNQQIDPINPQHQTLDNGREWSRVVTWGCPYPVTLQRWQLAILERFCDHILPFRTREGQRFLSWYYEGLDRGAREGSVRGAFRLDDSAGAANYIDKILAREESHHRVDYEICLRQIDRILRARDPAHEPANVIRDLYVDLYQEMAVDSVNGWDTSAYGSPRYFLEILRRHAFTGAFSHPKYGGNASTAGWAFLASRFPFDWRRSLEAPLGTNAVYRG